MEKMKLRRTNRKETSDSEHSSDSSDLPPINSSISESTNNDTKSNKRPGSPLEDDSLADFKVPKLNSRSNLARNGVKILDNSKRPTKTRSNPSRSSKKKTEANQMSIESSFFKPPTAFVCPLCLKSFNESSQQITHSKNCAAKNRISTKKLIAATELHERQAEERKAIGLPAAPIQQQQAKKTPRFKRMSTGNDPDVELAIALSKSLSEAKEMEELEEAVVLAAESNEKILEMSSSQRKSTLINFGFITNKPIISDFTEKPKKKKIGPTILQTRTEESRSRLLAEKIAEAIIDNVIATQRSTSPNDINQKYENKKLNFKSTMLKEMYRPDCKLWNGSVREESIEFYYIEALCKFIKPVEKVDKLPSGDKLSDSRSEDDKGIEFENVNENDCMSSISENVNKVHDLQKKQDPIFNSSISHEDSIKNEQILESISVNREDEKKEHDNINSWEDDRSKGLNPLALSWSKMVNSKSHSDVIIHVKHEKFIFSHFLVLWTRCCGIEKDCIANYVENNHNNNEDEYNTVSLEKKQQWKIMWEDIEYQAGIIFLEFIYCGIIINLEDLKDRSVLRDVKNLGHKYRIEELNTFLEKLEVQSENSNHKIQVIKNDEESYVEQNEDKDRKYSILKRCEDPNLSIEENKNEMSKNNENSTRDFEFKLTEITSQIIDGNDDIVNRENKNSVNKIDIDDLNTKNSEATIVIISEDELELSQIPKSTTKAYKNELLRESYMSVSPDIFDGMETMHLGNSFGKKHENTRDSINSSMDHCLGNDHVLSNCRELYDEKKQKIGDPKQEISYEKSFKFDGKKYPEEYFTQTVQEDLGKEELNIETNCSTNENIIETANYSRKKSTCKKLSKSISATRNNLSLFIEKIQRRNARFLESDTDEDDSIVMNQKKKKNPFKIGRQSDDDSGLLTNKFRRRDLINQEEENLGSDLSIETKSALSIFEDDIRKKVALEIQKKAENEINNLQENFLENTSDIEFVDEHWNNIKDSEIDGKDDKIDEEENKLNMDKKSLQKFDNSLTNESSVPSEEANSDGANESMYTKYKKTHKRNSIDKYRTALKYYFNTETKTAKAISTEEENNSDSSEASVESVKSMEESQQSSPDPINDQIGCDEKTGELKNKRISLINQKNLTELSSFDFYTIEDIPEEGHTENENSTPNSQTDINRSIDLTFSSDEEESTKTYSKVNENVLSSEKLSNKNNSTEDREIYEKNSDSKDESEAAEVIYSLSQNNVNRSRVQPGDNDISLIVETNSESHLPNVNWENRQSCHRTFSQFTGTPTVTENVTKILQECGILGSSYLNKDKSRISIADILSPIVLSSATDSDNENSIDDLPDNLFLNYDDKIENDNDNCDENNEEMNFTCFEYEGGANTDFAEFSDLRLSTHLPVTSSTQYLKTPPVNSRLSQRSEQLNNDISFEEEQKLPEIDKSSKSRRCSSISPLKNRSQRLLQVKSQSEGNFSNSRRSIGGVQGDKKTKNSKRKQNDQKNKEVCQFLGLSPSKVDISYNISPKESYDQLSSPELKRRLMSFGLKNQERRRAVKLLNFIWDQMHPSVPENLIPKDARNEHFDTENNGNEELEGNQHNKLRKIDEKNSSSEDDSKDEDANRLHRTGFPEEFEFSDDGEDNDKTHLDKSIQQNFEKLLETDHLLHRKILMYESISLDIFVEKLKESGLQVKPKILANYLDSECISYFIETPKKWSGNIRKNRRR